MLASTCREGGSACANHVMAGLAEKKQTPVLRALGQEKHMADTHWYSNAHGDSHHSIGFSRLAFMSLVK